MIQSVIQNGVENTVQNIIYISHNYKYRYSVYALHGVETGREFSWGLPVPLNRRGGGGGGNVMRVSTQVVSLFCSSTHWVDQM